MMDITALMTEVSSILKDTPGLAVGVIAIIYFYKAIVVGSIYGVVRHCFNKVSDVLEKNKAKECEVKNNAANRECEIKNKEIAHKDFIAKMEAAKKQYDLIDGFLIGGQWEGIKDQLKRLKGISSNGSKYVHSSDVRFLKEAIDEKLEREKKK